MDLSIGIVNWNTEAVLKKCLESIYQKTQGISYEIFVVDNASRDGSVDMVRALFPEVCLIINPENRGFAAANNQALRLAKGQYFLFLNPDTIIHDNALTTMVQFMEKHPEAGAIGCKLLNEDGSTQNSIRRFPTFTTVLLETTIMGRFPLLKRTMGVFKIKDFSFDQTIEVDAVCGAALLVRRDVLEDVGPMDEGYFMFIEELDLCQRIWAKGYQVFFVPDAQIIHLGGESRNQNPEGLMLVGLKSLFRYFKKFRGSPKTFLFKIFYKPLFLLNLIIDLIFDFIKVIRYWTIQRDPLKSKKKMIEIRGITNFLQHDLKYFLLKL